MLPLREREGGGERGRWGGEGGGEREREGEREKRMNSNVATVMYHLQSGGVKNPKKESFGTVFTTTLD